MALERGKEKVKGLVAGIESFWGDALAESVAGASTRPLLSPT
jgi:hypothetical protein